MPTSVSPKFGILQYRGKPWDKNKAGKFHPRNRGMNQSKFDARDKKNDGCFYCGKLGHYAKDC